MFTTNDMKHRIIHRRKISKNRIL